MRKRKKRKEPKFKVGDRVKFVVVEDEEMFREIRKVEVPKVGYVCLVEKSKFLPSSYVYGVSLGSKLYPGVPEASLSEAWLKTKYGMYADHPYEFDNNSKLQQAKLQHEASTEWATELLMSGKNKFKVGQRVQVSGDADKIPAWIVSFEWKKDHFQYVIDRCNRQIECHESNLVRQSQFQKGDWVRVHGEPEQSCSVVEMVEWSGTQYQYWLLRGNHKVRYAESMLREAKEKGMKKEPRFRIGQEVRVYKYQSCLPGEARSIPIYRYMVRYRDERFGEFAEEDLMFDT